MTEDCPAPEEEGEEVDTDSGEESADDEEESTDPEELLALGKKCLAAGDASGAVESFQEACSIM